MAFSLWLAVPLSINFTAALGFDPLPISRVVGVRVKRKNLASSLYRL
jgi:hypothetical protein